MTAQQCRRNDETACRKSRRRATHTTGFHARWSGRFPGPAFRSAPFSSGPALSKADAPSPPGNNNSRTFDSDLYAARAATRRRVTSPALRGCSCLVSPQPAGRSIEGRCHCDRGVHAELLRYCAGVGDRSATTSSPSIQSVRPYARDLQDWRPTVVENILRSGGGYDYDSTAIRLHAIRPRYDHSTTYVTTGLPHCGLDKYIVQRDYGSRVRSTSFGPK